MTYRPFPFIFLLFLFPFAIILNFSCKTTLIQDTYLITGKVVGITDGDTFTLLLQDSTTVKIRLASIDCPERKQPFYARAKQFASEAIFGKEVKVMVQSKDRYRRYIATVYYGRKCLNEELLSHGFAWHFRKYSKDAHLQHLEDQARRKKRGLWVDKKPVPPWEWRAR